MVQVVQSHGCGCGLWSNPFIEIGMFVSSVKLTLRLTKLNFGIPQLQFGLAARSLLVLMLTAEPNSSVHEPILQECCERFPRFWQLMWCYRDIVFSAAFTKATKGVLDYVGELMGRHSSIYIRQTYVDSTSP